MRNVWALILLALVLSGCSQLAVIEKPPLRDIPPERPVRIGADDVIENLAAGQDSSAFLLAARINDHRTFNGGKLLTWTPSLYLAAMAYVQTLAEAGCLGQPAACADGLELDGLAAQEGFDGFVDKNVYVTTNEPLNLLAALDAWLASDLHKRLLENMRLDAVGVAIVRLGNVTVYAAVLGRAP